MIDILLLQPSLNYAFHLLKTVLADQAALNFDSKYESSYIGIFQHPYPYKKGPTKNKPQSRKDKSI